MFVAVFWPIPTGEAAAVVPPKGWKVKPLGLARGSSRDAYLFVPPTYAPGKPSPLLVLLHGAGKGAADALATLGPQGLELLKSRACLLLVPESRGATWDVITTSSFKQDLPFIASALQQVLRSYSVDTRRLGLEGFSDGATYALSIGLGGPGLFSHVIVLSPGGFVPPAGRVKSAPGVFLAHGTRDTLFPIDQTSRRIASELGQLLPGRPVKYVQFSGGHEVDPSVQQQALEWFLAPSAP